MAVRNPQEPVLLAPTLFDGAFRTIGDKLKVQLSWLGNNYGRAEKIPTSDLLGRIIHEPLVYVGRENGYQNDYLNMLPDADLGNHVFFYLTDGQDIKQSLDTIERVSSEFSMVFWWDYRKVYPTTYLQMTLQNVLAEIYAALDTIKTPSFEISRQYIEAGSIYKEFNYQGNRGQKINQQMQDQFMMRPYGGVRLEGHISLKTNC